MSKVKKYRQEMSPKVREDSPRRLPVDEVMMARARKDSSESAVLLAALLSETQLSIRARQEGFSARVQVLKGEENVILSWYPNGGYVETAQGSTPVNNAREVACRARDILATLPVYEPLIEEKKPSPVEPVTIFGVTLRGREAEVWRDAVRRGELIIGLDMPLSSKLPDLWEDYCESIGMPHRIREEVS